jgi:TatD DNase family protein
VIPMWVDAHGHLCSTRYSETERLDSIDRAIHAGCVFFLQGGISPSDWAAQRQLADQYPGRIGVAVGLHPEWVSEASESDLQAALSAFDTEIESATDLACFGELGLHFLGEHGEGLVRNQQERVFKHCLEKIRDQGRTEPIVLHGVRAEGRMLEVWDSVFSSPRPGILHSFGGSWESAQAWIDRGLLISPSPGVARAGYSTLKQALPKLSLQSLVIESDCPDQSPGRTRVANPLGQPTDVLLVARAVARARGEPEEEGGRRLLEASRENLARSGIRLPAVTRS